MEWSDYYLPGGEALYDDFALIFSLSEGSAAGYWLQSCTSLDNASIVLLGSEGQFETLAPDLQTMLACLAIEDLPEFAPELAGDPASLALRKELKAVLRSATGIEDLDALVRAKSDSLEFRDWAERHCDRYEAEFAANPDVMALAGALDRYRPTSGEAWEIQGFNISWVGECIEVMIHDYGPKPFREGGLLIPHLAKLRTEAAIRSPGLGLWHSAMFSISGRGSIDFRPNYLYEPEFLGKQPSSNDYRSDQDRFPRASRRIPAWLKLHL